MPAPHRPLLAQRLLLVGLVCTMAVSVLLLVLLRSGRDRGRDERGPPDTGAERGAPELALADGSGIAAADAAGPASTHAPARAEIGVADDAATPADDAFDPGAVSGRVLHRGAPVADAELRLFVGALDHREQRAPFATASSDADGRFRFRGLVPHERVTVHAQHPGYLPEDETFFPGHADEIELEPAAMLSGTVRSAASGQPLAGIGVALDRWHFSAAGLEERVLAYSDHAGSWTLPWAEPGIQSLSVLRPGVLPERREFQVGPEGGAGYEILLEEGRFLELELYALESGQPLRETEVLADDVRVRTDASGRLRLPLASLGDDSVRLALALPGGCVTQGRAAAGGNASPAARSGFLRVPLARGGTVSGRVVDAAGAPVGGAIVRITGGGRAPGSVALPESFWLNAPRETVRSDADGRFTLVGQPPRENPVQVRAQHPAHPQGHSEPFAFAQLGQDVEVEVVLEQGGTLAGNVRLDGRPASLRVHWDSARGSGWTRSNDRGDYRFAGVPSGEVTVGARLDDEDEDASRPEDVVVWVEDGATAAADFDLVARRARIGGRVLDTLGAPVAEAEVVATLSAAEDEEEGLLSEEPRAESDGEGRFELSVPDTPGLAFDVWVESGPRHAFAESVAPGEQNLELVLPALAPVALRVIDALTREPVAGFHLYWRLSEDGEYQRLVQGGRRLAPGPDGTFLAELPAGRLDLVVSARAQGYVPSQRTRLDVFGASASAVEFELERGVELEIEVRTPPEASDGFAQLQRGRAALASEEQWSDRARGGDYFQQEVRNAQALRVDASGSGRVGALPSGHYRFFNGPKGFVFRPAEFELPPVAQHRITVELVPAPEKKPRDGGK